MKMYDPSRADNRTIVEKAVGLIYAMTDEQAAELRAKLKSMSLGQTAGAKRAAMFCMGGKND